MHSAACFLNPSNCPGRTVMCALTSKVAIGPPCVVCDPTPDCRLKQHDSRQLCSTSEAGAGWRPSYHADRHAGCFAPAVDLSLAAAIINASPGIASDRSITEVFMG